ncbi:hypothetical protein AAMO2058_000040900 [Amorphochlora amoebiformis]
MLKGVVLEDKKKTQSKFSTAVDPRVISYWWIQTRQVRKAAKFKAPETHRLTSTPPQHVLLSRETRRQLTLA